MVPDIDIHMSVTVSDIDIRYRHPLTAFRWMSIPDIDIGTDTGKVGDLSRKRRHWFDPRILRGILETNFT